MDKTREVTIELQKGVRDVRTYGWEPYAWIIVAHIPAGVHASAQVQVWPEVFVGVSVMMKGSQ